MRASYPVSPRRCERNFRDRARGIVLRVRLVVLASGLALTAAACSPASDEAARTPTRVRADYAATGDFYARPFPDDARLTAEGRPDLSGFPRAEGSVFLQKTIALAERDARGFATTAGVYFALDGPLERSVEADFSASLAPEAGVFLVNLASGERAPVRVHFDADGGPFGAPNLLALSPLQGRPLAPRARYAAVVRRTVRDAAGASLGVPRSLAELIAGRVPEGMSAAVAEEHSDALARLAELGVPSSSLAGLAVFTTDDPVAGLAAVRAAMLARPLPRPVEPFRADETFDDFCVFSSTIDMPDYQSGTPPFNEVGGDWRFDDAGAPIFQRDEPARLVVTVPRGKMPPAGFPIVLLSRTGAGGDRPLVDRGVQPATGEPALEPGTGPALEFARVGWAGASVDGPHGGLRNVTARDEQFLMFNITNPAALRDNVRQSAAELALQAHVLAALSFDASSCPGLDTGGAPVRFDASRLALMGHSMGGTIAPLTLAVEPGFHAAILSGAGGSYIENVLYKLHPVPVKGPAELLLGVAGQYSLTEQDPALNLFQWAAEPADPPVYAPYVVHAPREGTPTSVLMVQGIVDHYIMPTISQATSLSLGLDLAGEALDEDTPEIATFPTLAARLPFSGRARVALPARANIDPETTAVVVQAREDGVEDGHEVIFQTEGPKRQYRCFLASFAAGAPTVPPPSPESGPCP